MSEVVEEQGTTAIATVEAKPAPVALGEKGFEFKNSEDIYRWACAASKSGLVSKDYVNNPAAILIAVQHGRELGLSVVQSLQSIAVINGRPSIWGDGLIAIVQATGRIVDFKAEWIGEGDKLACKYTVWKKGIPTPYEWTFSLADAKTAGLLGKGTWASYPRRMLFNRARAFAMRDAFAEDLRGIGFREEVEDYNAMPAREERRSSVSLEVQS